MAEKLKQRRKIGSVLTVTLPSGYKVKARRPSMQTIVSLGDIPSDLTSMVALRLQGKFDMAALDKVGLQNAMKFADFYVSHVLVDPVYLLEAGAETTVAETEDGYLTGRLAAMDLPDEDKTFLWGVGHGLLLVDEETQEVQPSKLPEFPDGGHGSSPARPAGDPVPPATESSTEASAG